jgi:predicted amidophosphoribosyltransferase
MSIVSAFSHEGPARRLVHRLKYEGMVAAGEVLAAAMASVLPAGARALVPVPRALLRRVRYGVDPAVVLARLISSRTGLPVVAGLRPVLWWPHHAGAVRAARVMPRFRAGAPVPAGAILVDDVVTTGATLRAAQRACGATISLTATAAGRMQGDARVG